MSVPRSVRFTLLCAATTLGLLMAGAPQIASAATAAGHQSTYAAAAAGGGGAAPASVSPSGCVQFADYPHRSTHVPGTMNGLVRTSCRIYIPKISETAQMWESRWWGWDRIGIKGSVSDIDSKSASTSASDKCRNNSVRVTGSGSVVDVDGRTYYSSTESRHVTNPCGL